MAKKRVPKSSKQPKAAKKKPLFTVLPAHKPVLDQYIDVWANMGREKKHELPKRDLLLDAADKLCNSFAITDPKIKEVMGQVRRRS